MPERGGSRTSAAASSPVAASTEPTRSGASGRARSAPARSRSITRPAAVAPPAAPPTPSATATTRAAASPASWLSGRGPAIESAAASRTSVSSPGRTSGSVTVTPPTVLRFPVDLLETGRRIAGTASEPLLGEHRRLGQRLPAGACRRELRGVEPRSHQPVADQRVVDEPGRVRVQRAAGGGDQCRGPAPVVVAGGRVAQRQDDVGIDPASLLVRPLAGEAQPGQVGLVR